MPPGWNDGPSQRKEAFLGWSPDSFVAAMVNSISSRECSPKAEMEGRTGQEWRIAMVLIVCVLCALRVPSLAPATAYCRSNRLVRGSGHFACWPTVALPNLCFSAPNAITIAPIKRRKLGPNYSARGNIALIRAKVSRFFNYNNPLFLAPAFGTHKFPQPVTIPVPLSIYISAVARWLLGVCHCVLCVFCVLLSTRASYQAKPRRSK